MAEAIRGAAEFNEGQETALVRRVGNDVARLLEAGGLDGRLLDAFRTHIVSETEVTFDRANDGDKSYIEVALPLRMSDSIFSSQLVIGRKSVERWAGILGTAFGQHGIQPQYPEQTYDIANVWLAVHELGHGLGTMYEWLHRVKSSYPYEERWDYPISPSDFLMAHPESALAPHPDDACRIERERQAEGIGSLYLRQVLTEIGIADERQATLVVEAARATMDERAAPARSVLRPDVSLAEANLDKNPEDRHTGIIIGYANPLSIEELRQRFALREESLFS